MRKFKSVIVIATIAALLVSLGLPSLASESDLVSAVSQTAEYILKTVKEPVVEMVGGEWAIIGLARSGCDVPDEYYAGYYMAVEKYVREHGAVLHEKRYADNSRVILGLTAAGYDPRDVAGCDLTAALGDYEGTIWQGVNGPIFALLALDSMDYPIPDNPDAQTQATREMYISEILSKQLDAGGWNLTGNSSETSADQPSDADLTGMALQALAKYRQNPEVDAAINKALVRLSSMQKGNGGFASWGGEKIESTVQVLVALCELDIPFDDPRFVKNGCSTVDNILSYRNDDGGFRHVADIAGTDLMATEQALYGLAAALRSAEGRNTLYIMNDTAPRTPPGSDEQIGEGLPGKDENVRAVPVISPGKTFPDIQDHENRSAVEALAERGIITGKSETRFDPDGTMTRAEFATIVTRGLGLRQNGAPDVLIPGFFEDVIETDWFFGFVNIAARFGIVKGTSETTFNPQGTITRQEAAVMITRAAKLAGMDVERDETEIRNTLAQFGDYITVASWARGSMAFCYDEGFLDDTEFEIGPLAAVHRCEIAEMLFRMLDAARLLQASDG